MKNYYQILGVMPHDSPQRIKEAYRKLVMQYHPDLNPGQDNTAILQEINEAFKVLSDPEKKRNYDLLLYAYLQNLYSTQGHSVQSTPKEHTAPKEHTTATAQKVFYVRRRVKYTAKPSSPFIGRKDMIFPFAVLLVLAFIAFFIRFQRGGSYGHEAFRKSTIKTDTYAVNFSGKLPSPYLPDDFFEYSQITQLDLSRNGLYYLSPKFGNLRGLKALDLRHNELAHLHDAFSVMGEMVYLNLSNNPLGEFPEEILAMRKLEVLWMDSCQLRELPVEKMNFPHLRYLLLRGNPLRWEVRQALQKKFSRCYIVF